VAFLRSFLSFQKISEYQTCMTEKVKKSFFQYHFHAAFAANEVKNGKGSTIFKPMLISKAMFWS
jgi:hypothetical protein